MKKIYSTVLVLGSALVFPQCSSNDSKPSVDQTLNTQVVNDFATLVAYPQYNDLKAKTALLYDQTQALAISKTDVNLEACRQTWRDARAIWENSEAQLFGPVETDNIDPHIDTWPVNFSDLEAQLNSGHAFTEDYINDLEDALKGFHPIEYLIFGQNGTKKASDLTDRELAYLNALALNVKTLTSNLAEVWSTSSSSNYYHEFVNAGNGSSEFPTEQAALVQMVAAMADICGEVGEAKIGEVYAAQDGSLEESPFAKSSISDFTNNIKGIGMVYQAKYTGDGKGLEDIVKQYNLSLDNEIKTKLSTAITALNSITVPFGQAITTQKSQVQAAIDAIADLHETLDDGDDQTSTDLMGFIKLHSK